MLTLNPEIQKLGLETALKYLVKLVSKLESDWLQTEDGQEGFETYLQEYQDELLQTQEFLSLPKDIKETISFLWEEIFDENYCTYFFTGEGADLKLKPIDFIKVFWNDTRENDIWESLKSQDFRKEWSYTEDSKFEGWTIEEVYKTVAYSYSGDGMRNSRTETDEVLRYRYIDPSTGKTWIDPKDGKPKVFTNKFTTYEQWKKRYIYDIGLKKIAELPSIPESELPELPELPEVVEPESTPQQTPEPTPKPTPEPTSASQLAVGTEVYSLTTGDKGVINSAMTGGTSYAVKFGKKQKIMFPKDLSTIAPTLPTGKPLPKLRKR